MGSPIVVNDLVRAFSDGQRALDGVDDPRARRVRVEAVAADLCDALCSDYLPGALLEAPFALSANGHAGLAAAAHLVSGGPAALIGLAPPVIEIRHPSTPCWWNA